MVGAVSEIAPLSTEEVMTEASVGVDDGSRVGDKHTTTVAFDFGRITLDQQRVLYLFGAPGQERFWYLWDQLFAGSLQGLGAAGGKSLQTHHFLQPTDHVRVVVDNKRVGHVRQPITEAERFSLQ